VCLMSLSFMEKNTFIKSVNKTEKEENVPTELDNEMAVEEDFFTNADKTMEPVMQK